MGMGLWGFRKVPAGDDGEGLHVHEGVAPATLGEVMTFRLLVFVSLFLSAIAWMGCSSLMNSAATGMANNLTSAVLNQDDVLLVQEGAPAYLIAIDGLVQGDPQNPALLLAGAQLYSAYSSSFVTDPVRASRLSKKAMGFGCYAVIEHANFGWCAVIDHGAPSWYRSENKVHFGRSIFRVFCYEHFRGRTLVVVEHIDNNDH